MHRHHESEVLEDLVCGMPDHSAAIVPAESQVLVAGCVLHRQPHRLWSLARPTSTLEQLDLGTERPTFG